MKRAIVIVDHGSRREEASAQFEVVAERLRARLPDQLVVTAHLEIVEPNIAQAIALCAAQEVGEIVIHPYFLAAGRHTTHDIPAQVRSAAATHPKIRISISQALGLHPALIDAIVDRVSESADCDLVSEGVC
jgi:sirohydrochlorin ferrochelatase